jgi:GNAT superfamily N-acetyltransferase
MEIAVAAREQALHPFRDLPTPTGWRRVEGIYVTACLHPLPIARVIDPGEIRLGDVEAAVAEARAIVRDNAGSVLIWWLDPEHGWLGEHLERCGLVNDATPGFEATENAMALVQAPRGEVPADVDVELVTTFEDFAASERVQAEVFGMTEADDSDLDAEFALRHEQYATPGNPLRQFNARLDGSVVGTATAVAGDAGLNLFGGSVLPEARGRGVYRALIEARWELAVEYGTPCLTVQAGRMSRPIVEKAGFEFLAAVRIYVDDLAPR